MTNYENVKNKINDPDEMFQILDVRGASNYGYENDMPWCKYKESVDRYHCYGDCCDCFKSWLSKSMMPEIKNGDYVFVKNINLEDGIALGVVVNNIIVYENGQWNFINDIKDDIVIISQGPGFAVAKDPNSYIWRKNS